MNIRPATTADVQKFWGKELPLSIRGYVAEHNGEIMGVAGLAYMQHNILAFADMKPEGQKYPVTIMKITRLVVALLNSVKAPVYCNADVTLPGAAKFLQHIGFKPAGGRTYVWSKE